MTRFRNGNTVALLLLDAIVIDLCILLAFYTRAGLEMWLGLVPLGHGLSLYWVDLWWIPAAAILTIAYYGGYGLIMTVWDEVPVLFKGLLVSFLIVWVALSLQKEAATVSRILLTLSFVYMVVIMPLARFFVKFILYKVLARRKAAFLFERRKGDRRNLLRASLNKEWYSGYVIVDNVGLETLEGRIDTCFVPMECTDEATIKALKRKVGQMIIVSSISGLSFMNTQIKTFLTKNIVLITTDNGLLSLRRTAFKRILDITVSVAALTLLSPLFVIIPVAIKLDSRGPVFFTHKRCGINLDQFNMIKYRTMQVGADSLMQDYLNNDAEASKEFKERNKLKTDPRITRIGKILRKTSLDEIPQFLNVIKGDMSLVGPRPDMRDALDEFLESYAAIYSSVRPGMTGLWQVSGRSEIKYDERARLDYLYVLNWSLWLDFVIILKTFRALLGGKGAY